MLIILSISGPPVWRNRQTSTAAPSKKSNVIAGSIGSLGTNYVLGLKAINCQLGDTLAQEQVTVDAKEKVLNQLGEAATRLRGKLGESLASIQRFDRRMQQVTTSSFAALKAYTDGRRVFEQSGDSTSIPLFQRMASTESGYGDAPAARRSIAAALALPASRDVHVGAAQVLAEIGDAAQAEKLLDALDREHPTDSLIQGCYLPAIRGQIQLNRGNAKGAIELPEPTRPLELGVGLYPAWQS